MRRKHYGHRARVARQIDGNASSKRRIREKETSVGNPYVAEAKRKRGKALGSLSGAKAKYSLSRPGRKIGGRRQIGGEVGDAPSPASQVPPTSQPAIPRLVPAGTRLATPLETMLRRHAGLTGGILKVQS